MCIRDRIPKKTPGRLAGRGPAAAAHAAHHAAAPLRVRHGGCGGPADRTYAVGMAGCQAGGLLQGEHL
eukprot:4653560-Alexandrium_andersonii.AAC.1